MAVATGWLYRAARRLGIETSASRQAELQRARHLPDGAELVTVGSGEKILRVVLLGNGPAESPGVPAGADAFPSHLARALVARTHLRVEVRVLIGAAFDLPALAQLLQEERPHWRDALVVTAAYRPQLAEMPLARWAAYAEALRATLVNAVPPQTAIRVLSLPWRDAARDAPLQWGGLFGNRVRVVAEIAEATLTPAQPARQLRLLGPAMAKEWIGPAFSAQTYVRWAEQVAAELCTAWRI